MIRGKMKQIQKIIDKSANPCCLITNSRTTKLDSQQEFFCIINRFLEILSQAEEQFSFKEELLTSVCREHKLRPLIKYTFSPSSWKPETGSSGFLWIWSDGNLGFLASCSGRDIAGIKSILHPETVQLGCPSVFTLEASKLLQRKATLSSLCGYFEVELRGEGTSSLGSLFLSLTVTLWFILRNICWSSSLFLAPELLKPEEFPSDNSYKSEEHLLIFITNPSESHEVEFFRFFFFYGCVCLAGS